MSSDEDFDHEAYREYEDQLYHEDSGSEDDLDSDVAEALYSQVHYASSLLVSEESTSGRKNAATRTDDNYSVNVRQQKCLVDNSVIEISSDNAGDDDGDDDDETIIDSVCSSSLAYPEVINIFSDDIDTHLAARKPKLTLEKNVEPGERTENWDVNGEGLEHLTKAKRYARYYTSGKGLPHVKCYNCNKRGHQSQDCPEPKKISVCHLCGVSGHVRRNCPNELCFNCHEPGHLSKHCQKSRTRPFDRCKRCHVLGHLANDCPDRWRQYHLTTEVGPIVLPNKSASPPRSVYCYNCGFQGHYGHECWEKIALWKGELPLPFVVKYDVADRQVSSARGKNNRENQRSAHELRGEREPERKADRRSEQGTQQEYDDTKPSQDTYEDYDRDRSSYQGPLNKVQKRNHGDFRKVSFSNDTGRNGEFNNPFTERLLTKRKKKNRIERRDETTEKSERIVELVESIPTDEGLTGEPYNTKKKKSEKRKNWQDGRRFVGDSHNNPIIEHKKFKQNNDRRFTSSPRTKGFRSFEDRDLNGRTAKTKRDQRNFTSSRGFRFKNQTHGKKSDPQYFKHYTF